MNFGHDLDFYTRMIPSVKQRALAWRMSSGIRRDHTDRGVVRYAGGVWLVELDGDELATDLRCAPPLIDLVHRLGART